MLLLHNRLKIRKVEKHPADAVVVVAQCLQFVIKIVKKRHYDHFIVPFLNLIVFSIYSDVAVVTISHKSVLPHSPAPPNSATFR